MRIIAELGQNTQGLYKHALRMIQAAHDAGCDGVKVQAYNTEDFLPLDHPDWDMFEGNRLSWSEIELLRIAAEKYGLEFGATPTSLEGVERLYGMGVDFLKNGSDYLLRRDMIEAMLATGIETWVSTGMASIDDVLAVPDGALLMACTSLYPCPDEDANLLRLIRPIPVFDGYSDHTEGSIAAIIACSLGAEMLEKHFTFDHDLPGPDHSFSADPKEMTELVQCVRVTEQMLGSGLVEPALAEIANREQWRVTEKNPHRG